MVGSNIDDGFMHSVDLNRAPQQRQTRQRSDMQEML